MKNYEFLLEDISILKGIGKKTNNILKKKRLIIYLIYCGDCHNHIRTDHLKQKLTHYK